MTRKATSLKTSIQRSAGSNSRQSKAVTSLELVDGGVLWYAGAAPRLPRGPEPGGLCLQPGAQGVAVGRRRAVRHQAFEGAQRIPRDDLGRGPGRIRPGHLGGGVESGQPLRQPVQVLGLQAAGRQLLAEQGAGREFMHAQRIFDRRAVAVQPRRGRRAVDGHHVDVDRGRQAAVQPQFLEAQPGARGQVAEVQEGQLDRLLDLPGEAAVEQHPRDMCLHDAGTELAAQRRHQFGAGRAGKVWRSARHGCDRARSVTAQA